jgi:predicted DNA binding protein
MIDLTLDMTQYDCPFIDTTADYEVSFSASNWKFDPTARELDTRMIVEGEGNGALGAGLRAVSEHDHMHDYRLLRKGGASAEIATTIHETDAMATVRDGGGYITGPFYIEDGSELWHVGFDGEPAADEVLADLERDNDFRVESRERIDDAAVGGIIRNAEAAARMLDGCRSLTTVERDTLEVAVEGGYFDSPRGITLGELADRFDVSKPAVSKNLRRGQRKLLGRIVDAIGDLEDFP